MHKLFDNGEGRTTIAGGQGTMWTTVLQMGELIETALATFDRSETRIFISHMSPGREGLLAQLALALRVLPSHNLTNSRPTLPLSIWYLIQRFLCQSHLGSFPQSPYSISILIFGCLGYRQARGSSYRSAAPEEAYRQCAPNY